MAAAAMEKINGTIKNVTFRNPENGYSVFKVFVGKDRPLIPVVGVAPDLSAGENLSAWGHFKNDPKYGMQFKMTKLDMDVAVPQTAVGIEKLLGHGFLPYIGKGIGKKLVETFGKEVFEILEKNPEKFLDISGISEAKLGLIKEAYKDKMDERKALVYCSRLDITPKMAEKLLDVYGPDLFDVLETNPYQLIYDVKGISFLKADKIAMASGIRLTDPNRVNAGVLFVMDKMKEDGSCACPVKDFKAKAAEILNVDAHLIQDGVDADLADGSLVLAKIRRTPCLFLRPLYESEQRIAMNLFRIKNSFINREPEDKAIAIYDAESESGIKLDEKQRDAVRAATDNNVLVITGGPGVGKTTIVKTIISVYEREGCKILCAAPTGRAAKRMKESTGKDARTIHRLLEFSPDGGFKRHEGNPLEGDILIVDECSMIDVRLMDSLLRAVPRNMKVIFVGDADQLPSVGPGQVLLDMIESKKIPVARLTRIFRQKETSAIVVSAHEVNDGKVPSLKNEKGKDFVYFEADDPEACVGDIMALVTKHIPSRLGKDPMKDVQVLCPMKNSAMGTEAMNNSLQAALNKNSVKKGGKCLRLNGIAFYEGDKVMQIRNDYMKGVFNGDIGYVEAVSVDEKVLFVDFDGNLVRYEEPEIGSLRLSYACTIHKSQGSEYPVVIIPLMTSHFMMLQRKLLYTGITRGKELVILVGQKKAVRMAVRGKKAEFNRWTKLCDWLKQIG